MSGARDKEREVLWAVLDAAEGFLTPERAAILSLLERVVLLEAKVRELSEKAEGGP